MGDANSALFPSLRQWHSLCHSWSTVWRQCSLRARRDLLLFLPGVAFLSAFRGLTPGVNYQCCPPGSQLNGHGLSLCLSFPCSNTKAAGFLCFTERLTHRHACEDHCNKNITEKQSIIFRTSLCTLSDTTSSGGTLADQGRE